MGKDREYLLEQIEGDIDDEKKKDVDEFLRKRKQLDRRVMISLLYANLPFFVLDTVAKRPSEACPPCPYRTTTAFNTTAAPSASEYYGSSKYSRQRSTSSMLRSPSGGDCRNPQLDVWSTFYGAIIDIILVYWIVAGVAMLYIIFKRAQLNERYADYVLILGNREIENWKPSITWHWKPSTVGQILFGMAIWDKKEVAKKLRDAKSYFRVYSSIFLFCIAVGVFEGLPRCKEVNVHDLMLAIHNYDGNVSGALSFVKIFVMYLTLYYGVLLVALYRILFRILQNEQRVHELIGLQSIVIGNVIYKVELRKIGRTDDEIEKNIEKLPVVIA